MSPGLDDFCCGPDGMINGMPLHAVLLFRRLRGYEVCCMASANGACGALVSEAIAACDVLVRFLLVG
jgi:hypothetical protein